MGHGSEAAFNVRFATEVFRYLLLEPAPGPTWTLHDFDFDRDYNRLQTMQALYDAKNLDLRKLKGKLLIFQGLNDNTVLARNVIYYYETVERTMGGQAATRSFARLFLLPGVSHGGPWGGRDVGAGTLDYLSALEAWVEEGKAPDQLTAARSKEPKSWTTDFPFPLEAAKVQFTRPVYPYLLRAKYKGRGNPDDAANFGPVRP